MNDRTGELVGTAGFAGRTRYTLLEYEAVLANASIGVAFTRDRKFFLCNPKFAEMFGWSPEELIGQPGEVVYASLESYQALGQIAVPVLSAGRQLDLEWEMRRKDGSTFLARMIAKAINPEQTQQGTVWIVEDITERKRDADEVARLLREQDAILDTASIGICFVRDRCVVRSNRRFEEMHGYASGALVGKPTSITFASQADYEAVGEGYARLARGAAYSVITESSRKDGSTYWSRITGRAVDSADPAKGSVWIDEDITEQQRAEGELARVLAEQHALLNTVVVGIAFIRDRVVQRANRRFEELFGYHPGEAGGAPTRQMYFTDDEYDKWGRAEEELAGGRVHAREQWVRRRDGSGFWCRLSGRAVEAADPAKGHVWLFEDISERRRADEAAQRLVREQNALLEGATIGIAFIKEQRVARCNPRFEEIFGYAQGEMLDQSVRPLYAVEEDFEGGETLHEQVWRSETVRRTCRMLCKDGREIWCQVSRRAMNPNDPAQGSVWLFDDVTLERQADDRVRQAYLEQELIFDFATVGIVYLRDRVIQRCNPMMGEMFGYAPQEMVDKSIAVIHRDKDSYDAAGTESYGKLGEGGTFTAERQLRRKDGSTFWCKVVGKSIFPERPQEGTIWICDDISAERATRDSLVASREALEASRESLEKAVAERTAELKAANDRLQQEIGERKQAENRAQHLADHDALTGLPNRRLLEDRLTQALALSYRNRKLTAAMFIDLDRFKTINDSMGHAAGDVLLKEVAVRLAKQLRIGDTICRIGGDEFVIVLPEIKRSTDAANVAQKVIEGLSQPIRVQDRDLIVTPSIGISVFPDDGRDAETLIRNADAAMYHAKESGRCNYQFFTDQMNLAASRRLQIESDLRRALQKGELAVHYQPITELKTGGFVCGHEALVRWNHPTRGLVVPSEFIQLAEETGLILQIGEWVLEQACRWAVSLGAERGLLIAVNLSARQFNDPKLVDTVSRVLRETGLPAKQLELEITESTVMQHIDVTQNTLKKLKQLGVSVAIDDFGTGYSSFAYLKRFPVDKLKIDKSFIADIPANKDDSAIVAAILGLARTLELAVVAEGVETEAQMEFLQQYRCDYIQGYLVGKPVDGDTAAKKYD
ncbi:MAG: bifunctional diguanylate cyclase/phosphodiesterase [Betaproteobacteria bacterium]|nr:bifunctional diguanylate cyclase/phosphodiesterase [Betaproteobacteria bacterium]